MDWMIDLYGEHCHESILLSARTFSFLLNGLLNMEDISVFALLEWFNR